MKRVILALVAMAAVGVWGVTAPAVQSAAQAQAAKPAQGAMAAGPQRNWYSVTIVTVKPEMLTEWMEFQKSQAIPMQQKGGVKSRDTWQSGAPFGEGFTFGIVTPIEKFETYDSPPLPQRVLGTDAGRAYGEKNRRLVSSTRTYAMQDRAELSIMPAANAKVVAAILTDLTIVNGHAEQYEAYIKNDLLPVLKKGNAIGYLVSRTIFGGDGNEYHTLQLLDSFAEIDKGPLTRRVLGDAVQALNAKLVPHVASLNRTILRYVPDLSFRPKASS
jgi:hypothetical protein